MKAELLATIVDALFEDRDTLIGAVLADGWPRRMVEVGFALHRRTWDVDVIAAALEAELATLGPMEVPRSVGHVWPPLPGAGVTPVLWAYLLGVSVQQVRPSRRAPHFARHFVDVWQRFDGSVELVEDLPTAADRIVVSGSDATIDAIIEQVGRERVVGYGDRQSFAVVVDDGDPARHVEGLATDVALWLGQGCFSVRAVLFVGTEAHAHVFAARLAQAMGQRELELEGKGIDEGLYAARMQGLGVAEMQTNVWPARIGWVEQRPRWSGAPRLADVVVLCVCNDPADVLDLPERHLQGVAWGGPGAETAERLGVTRVCEPGELQAPPGDWQHDGCGNAAALLGLCPGRVEPA